MKRRIENPEVVRAYRRDSLERERKVREHHNNFSRLGQIRTALLRQA